MYYRCGKVCGKICMNYTRLRTHMVAHDDRVSHQCPECPKSFKYKHHLKEHLATHTGTFARPAF